MGKKENFERGEFCSRRQTIVERSRVPAVCGTALSNCSEEKKITRLGMPKQERRVEAKVEDIRSALEKELWAVFAGKVY